MAEFVRSLLPSVSALWFAPMIFRLRPRRLSSARKQVRGPWLLLLSAGLLPASTLSAATVETPEAALQRFHIAQGLVADLFAAEPMVENPVSFCFDDYGRLFLVETTRRRSSVFDIRGHPPWLDEDFTFRTVEDRAAFYRRTITPEHTADIDRLTRGPRGDLRDFNEDGQVDWRDLEVQKERIRILEDTDGDGRADRVGVFAEGFNSLVSGVAAGVMTFEGNVYFTCIPELWRLTDEDHDGKADRRDALIDGFGVHIAFGGHDMHGLAVGPDGRIYWSIADRGTSTNHFAQLAHSFPGLTAEKLAHSGCIFRCNPDGTGFEIVAMGMRNPQELAFDDYGNLFTGDNNGDGGDPARWVQVVPGGDSGWTLGWQWLPQMGAWNSEKLWAGFETNDAPHLLPPLAHIGHGPSGLACYPGTGLPDRYAHHFFMCDFPGNVLAWTNRARGATFAAGPVEVFFGDLGPSDLDFAPGGGLYVADWFKTFDKTGKGRIYRIRDPQLDNDPLILETREVLRRDMRLLPERHRLDWLGHIDRRVRLKAQFSLAEFRHFRSLRQTALHDDRPLARLHALWAIGQIARSLPVSEFEGELTTLLPLLQDPDPEIRSQAAMLMGEGRLLLAQGDLSHLFKDPSPRVQYHAIMAYRELFRAFSSGGHRYSVPFFTKVRSWWSEMVGGQPQPTGASLLWPTMELEPLLIRNADPVDPYLRHACVLLLTEMGGTMFPGSSSTFNVHMPRFLQHTNASVRMAMLQALRRLGDPNIARFLSDPEPHLALEAARAIYDVPIPDALPNLAAWLTLETPDFSSHPTWERFILRRVLYANYRLGDAPHAKALVRMASLEGCPLDLRVEALERLADWDKPSARDPVVGLSRPLPDRSPASAADALQPSLLLFQADDNEAVVVAATKAAAALNLSLPDPLASLQNTSLPAAVRLQSLQLMSRDKDQRLSQAIDAALQDIHPTLRLAGLELLVQHQPENALPVLAHILQTGTVPEKQAALRHLGELDGAQLLLQSWWDRLLAGDVPRELQLDVLEAVRQRGHLPPDALLDNWENALDPNDPLAPYRISLWGGDPVAGRKVFFERQDAACLRCHKIQGEGGEVGPDLAGIASRKTREYLLESIVIPNKAVAEGFESVIVVTHNGDAYAGVVVKETDQELQINSPEEGVVTVKKADIESREAGLSAMLPELATILGPRDLRDLIAFLTTLE